MSIWIIACLSYLSLALITLMPVLFARLKRIPPLPSGKNPFEKCDYFDKFHKDCLGEHHSRIEGTLLFWKRAALYNGRFHYYVLGWTIPISIVMPLILTFVEIEGDVRLFFVLLSVHSAIMLSFYRALKTERNYKAFRNGESEFYDLQRRLLDRPEAFCNARLVSREDVQDLIIRNYFEKVEAIRRNVRAAETDSFPALEDFLS